LLGIYGTIWIDFYLIAVVIFEIWMESLIKLMVLEVPDTIPQYPPMHKKLDLVISIELIPKVRLGIVPLDSHRPDCRKTVSLLRYIGIWMFELYVKSHD
jgi:hypothetical protein